jgi:hypothetical protein
VPAKSAISNVRASFTSTQKRKPSFHRESREFKPLTSAEWTSVLRLSTMWELAEVREKAIAELSSLMPGDFHHLLFDKIMLAKECKVRQWLIDGYVELVVRQRIISVEEAEVLGWETAARLLRVREEYRIDPSASSTLPALGPSAPSPALNCTCETCVVPKTPRTFEQQRREIIEREFENELKYMTP